MRQFLLLLIAILVIAVLGGGVYWGVGTETRAASGLTDKAYGPSGDSYVFKVPVVGENSPAKDCVVCHSVAREGVLRVAPGLWGIVGARKARAGWFAYSPALSKAGGVWSEDDLHKYLTNPSGYIPGTKKTISGIADKAARDEIIGYLATLK